MSTSTTPRTPMLALNFLTFGAIFTCGTIIFAAGVFTERTRTSVELARMEGQIQLVQATLATHSVGPPHVGVSETLAEIITRLTVVESRISFEAER